MKNIAIFASGGGSNFISIHKYIQLGMIPACIKLVVSNNPDSGAIKYAKKNKITTFILKKMFQTTLVDREKLLSQTLYKNNIDLICLAGYMKLLSKGIVQQYPNCILNIHPALLPAFGGKGYYGMKVHEAVIAAGESTSGATVHFVNEQYDNGKIIIQEEVEINSEDTAEILAKRVLKVEHELYPKVVKAFCEDRILWENNHPIIEVPIEN